MSGPRLMSGGPTGGARARAEAARAVRAVVQGGRTLDEALAGRHGTASSRATCQALAYGAVRWFHELDACLGLLTGRSPQSLSPLVRALAIVGLYQLAHARTAPHAAVSETVAAARLVGQARAAGLVNAVLRRFQRERADILAAAHHDAQARHAHPAWLLETLCADWPGEWENLVAAGNEQPPMWLRVNLRRGTREAYLARLEAAAMPATAGELVPEAACLARPVPVSDLPGFAAGEVSVQDAAAQLAAHLVQAAPGMRVLDACAAPGGKACHLLELQPGIGELVALDIDAGRAARIGENLSRLGLDARVLTGDAGEPGAWWDGRPFDRILVDAPCSGTGVIRRHPDIKLLRRPADIDGFVAGQRRLLDALWPLLAPGGRLVYATCSVLRAENAQLVGDFLAAHPGAADVTGSARLFPVGRPDGPGPGVALPTGAGGADGFYYACLEQRRRG